MTPLNILRASTPKQQANDESSVPQVISTLHGPVSALMREVADTVVVPRFRKLAAHEIVEKSPGELVTIADRESEERLNEGLFRILPEARLVGEEACAADPTLMNGLGSGAAWIIDPIDGTSNFAEGKPPFAIMIALVADGDIQAGWMLDPLTGRMCHASAGGGAWIDDDRVTTRPSGAPLPLAGISTLFMRPEDRDAFIARASGRMTLADIPRCCGEQYPRIVLGTVDLALYERVLPWDHAPGALFLAEAGGVVRRTDGSPYRIGDHRSGLLAAGSQRVWNEAATILF
jgi:fructose-1,6-bisphosphatase/inositol monophosphatase family enzyme